MMALSVGIRLDCKVAKVSIAPYHLSNITYVHRKNNRYPSAVTFNGADSYIRKCRDKSGAEF